MNVFILSSEHYDGEAIIGVFSLQLQAVDAAHADAKDNGHQLYLSYSSPKEMTLRDKRGGDFWWYIREFDVQGYATPASRQ